MGHVTSAQAKKLGIIPGKRTSRAKATVQAVVGLFEAACVAHGLMEPVPEYCFAPPRLWRFDYCWPEKKIALEIEGGIWAGKPCHTCGMRRGGRHNSGTGMMADISKYNEAALLGWRVLRCVPEDIKTGKVFALLKAALA